MEARNRDAAASYDGFDLRSTFCFPEQAFDWRLSESDLWADVRQATLQSCGASINTISHPIYHNSRLIASMIVLCGEEVG